jgi:hypothetical protein
MFIHAARAQNNTAAGDGAGNSGSDNTSIGQQANDVVTGSGNTSVGSLAGLAITSGGQNTLVGYISGRRITTGTENAFFGRATGFMQTTASSNSFFGSGAGYNTTTGSNNVMIGSYAGAGNLVGTGNVFIGYYAAYNETASNKLYVDNSTTATPLVYGDFSTDQVGINALPPTGYTLAVGGKAIMEEVVVKLRANWPDYVFEDAYHLPTYAELDRYIQINRHLPGVPSEAEVKAQGVSLGEMNAVLLKKIEELTLYILEQDKRLRQLEKGVGRR